MFTTAPQMDHNRKKSKAKYLELCVFTTQYLISFKFIYIEEWRKQLYLSGVEKAKPLCRIAGGRV